jgi:MFS family permease
MVELGFTPRALALRRVPAEMRRVFGEGMKRGVRHPVLRWMVWTTFVSSSFGIFGYYSWQRYFLDLLGRELVWVSGLVSAGFALSGIVGNRLIKRISSRLPSRTGYLAVAASAQALLIVVCGVAGSFAAAVGCYLAYALVVGATSPVKQAYLNAHIPSEHRATLLSLDSFYGSVGGTLGQSGWGWYSRERTIAAAWVRAGACLVVGVPLYLLARRADRRTSAGEAAADRFA